ncbi:MAG TPA: 6,7-dimethyl-8-ribityllumazine synthase [Pyrinomonadaceae bacterium]|nr:6,7-dimethyl-8-ribityllumazine synthase [Pyrinomonadaceae bacterium]
MKTELNRDDVSASGFRFAIVTARWNDAFTSRLEAGAVDALAGRGAQRADIETFYVPGAFELPAACLKAAKSGEFHAVIALGVVIRGDTPHFDYVAGQAAAGIMQASLLTDVPVMFGVITAENAEQADARCGEKADNKGYEAALSAIEMANLFQDMTQRLEDRWIERRDKLFNVV